MTRSVRQWYGQWRAKESLKKSLANLQEIKIFIKILKKLYSNFGKMLESVRNYLKILRKFQRDSV